MLLTHQRSPTEADVIGDIDLAEPDHLPTGAHCLGALAERNGTTGGFEHDIGAAAFGQGAGKFDWILARGIHSVPGAELARERKLPIIQIDRDHGGCASQHRTLHGR